MKTVIVLAVGFFLGVAYMNGTLGDFGDITRNLVNATAEQIAEATEPTTVEILEEKYKELEQEVVDTVQQ